MMVKWKWYYWIFSFREKDNEEKVVQAKHRWTFVGEKKMNKLKYLLKPCVFRAWQSKKKWKILPKKPYKKFIILLGIQFCSEYPPDNVNRKTLYVFSTLKNIQTPRRRIFDTHCENSSIRLGFIFFSFYGY